MEVIKPHQIKSRPVEVKDYARVYRDAKLILPLCEKPSDKYFSGAEALCHCQVTDHDPLRFFVMRDGDIIMNPEIIQVMNNNKQIKDFEGCLSYPGRNVTKLRRFKRIRVRYDLMVGEAAVKKGIEEELSMLRARIFQHEIDHMNAIYIYDYNKGKGRPHDHY